MPSTAKPGKQLKDIRIDPVTHGTDVLTSSTAKRREGSSGPLRRPSHQTRPGSADPALQCSDAVTEDEDSVTTIDTIPSMRRPDSPPASPEPSKELVAAVQRIASAVSLPQALSDTDLVTQASAASRTPDLPLLAQVKQGVIVDLLQQLVDLLKRAVDTTQASNILEKTLATSDKTATSGQVQEFMRLLRGVIQPDVLPAEPASTTESCPQPTEQASKLTYKSVREVWDKIIYAYKPVSASAVADAAENEHDEYLFVVRNRTERSSEKAIKYIDVNSAAIRDMLRDVLKDVRGVSLREERPSIEQTVLFHYFDEISEQHRCMQEAESPDEVRSTHLNVLLQYLRSEYRDVRDRLQDAKEIDFDLLWTLFEPNVDVVTFCLNTDAPRCVRCNFAEERKRNDGSVYFHIEGRYLNSDGKTLGLATTVLSIEKFRGAKTINLLSAYPLRYHQDPTELTEQLVNCGRRFVRLLGVHHQTYEGKAFYVNPKGHRITTSVSKSRIMVDAAYFRERNPNYTVATVEPIEDVCDPHYLWFYVEDPVAVQEAPIRAIQEDPETLPEQDLLICSPTVLGYSLKYKMWLEFAVMNISDITWDQTSFGRLVIPEDQKRVVLALSEAHSGWGSNVRFEDIVAEKGQGMVVLLHGPPGVGKTLTAETVSEYVRRPFYTISAGELGTTPGELEEKLSDVLEMSSHWKVTLLLDEADIFVEQRSSHDVTRNALVCIFLRKLEYYPGIIFFTTNRVKTIDEAIASRIHLSLRYGAIKPPSRQELWETQLAKAVTPYGKASYTSKDLEYLARQPLNGRDITNITSAAQALAAHDKAAVNLNYLKHPIELNQQFQADFRGAGHFENENSYA